MREIVSNRLGYEQAVNDISTRISCRLPAGGIALLSIQRGQTWCAHHPYSIGHCSFQKESTLLSDFGAFLGSDGKLES